MCLAGLSRDDELAFKGGGGGGMQGMSDWLCQEHVTTAAVTAVIHPRPFSLLLHFGFL